MEEKNNTEEKYNIEEKLSMLDGVLKKLESGNLSIGEALSEYERGIEIVKNTKALIERARKKIEIISAGEVSDQDGEDE